MITPKAFLSIAETLINGSNEEEWRTAVSRGYYAAFHEARLLFSELGFRVPRADSAHAYLWLRLSNCGDTTLKAVGANLNTLRTDRNRADYELHRNLDHADALIQVQTAREIMHHLDAARIDPTRTQIRDAMRDYERNVLHQVTWQGP